MDPIDIKIKQIHKQDSKNLQASQLIIEFSGLTVNSSLVNTIRRLSYDHIPTYAFPTENITIEKNSSIFNNDYMKLRLSQITIPDINNNIYFLEDRYWKDINFNDPEREKHIDDKKILELYVTVTNNTNEIMNVTTEDVKIFENGEELKNKFDPKFPCLIIQLRPSEVFSCRCVGVLGIGKINNIWAGASNCYYDELDEHKFKFTIESQGQMDEYEILHKGCKALKEKINIVKKVILDKYNIPQIKGTNKLKIIIENEDHTIGNIINEYLQNNKNILYSGMSKPDLLVDNIIIKFVSVKNDPIIPLIETLDYINKIFSTIGSNLETMGKNFIKYEINKSEEEKKK